MDGRPNRRNKVAFFKFLQRNVDVAWHCPLRDSSINKVVRIVLFRVITIPSSTSSVNQVYLGLVYSIDGSGVVSGVGIGRKF